MKQRVTSAIILLAISLTCVFLSYITRVLFFAVAGILCAYEYSRGLEHINVYCAAWVMYVYIAVQAVECAKCILGFIFVKRRVWVRDLVNGV